MQDISRESRRRPRSATAWDGKDLGRAVGSAFWRDGGLSFHAWDRGLRRLVGWRNSRIFMTYSDYLVPRAGHQNGRQDSANSKLSNPFSTAIIAGRPARCLWF